MWKTSKTNIFNIILYWFFGNLTLCTLIPLTSQSLHNHPPPLQHDPKLIKNKTKPLLQENLTLLLQISNTSSFILVHGDPQCHTVYSFCPISPTTKCSLQWVIQDLWFLPHHHHWAGPLSKLLSDTLPYLIALNHGDSVGYCSVGPVPSHTLAGQRRGSS